MRAALVVASLLATTFFTPLDADTSTVTEETLPMTLRGAFGAVVGGTDVDPATAYPGVPLDTYIRSAPLQLELLSLPLNAVADLRIEAAPVDGGGVVVLSDGAMEFAGPDQPGDSVVTAVLTTASGTRATSAWLLRVPDRSGGTGSLFEIVPPAILVSSSQGSTTGAAGNGCYAYLCSDIGMLGPIESVPSLRVEVGETLTVATADGSGLVGWHGRLHRLPLTGETAARALEHAAPDVVDRLRLTGLEPPGPGAWLLELRVDFDRERGHLWHAYRLELGDGDRSSEGQVDGG